MPEQTDVPVPSAAADVRDLVEASSLGTPGARQLRARTTAEQRTAVAQRADRYAAALRADAAARMARLEEAAGELPVEGSPPVLLAYEHARQAVAAAQAALRVDPTLAGRDRDRDLELLQEILRQIKPLGRQAESRLKRDRLAPFRGLPGTDKQIARLGKINEQAPEELIALAARIVELGVQLGEAAQPDWESPERIRERSARLLPSPDRLQEVAEELRYLVRASLACPHPAPEAVRLDAVADQITAPTGPEEARRAELAKAIGAASDASWGDLLEYAQHLKGLLYLDTVLVEVLDMVDEEQMSAEAALRRIREAIAASQREDFEEDFEEGEEEPGG